MDKKINDRRRRHLYSDNFAASSSKFNISRENYLHRYYKSQHSSNIKPIVDGFYKIPKRKSNNLEASNQGSNDNMNLESGGSVDNDDSPIFPRIGWSVSNLKTIFGNSGFVGNSCFATIGENHSEIIFMKLVPQELQFCSVDFIESSKNLNGGSQNLSLSSNQIPNFLNTKHCIKVQKILENDSYKHCSSMIYCPKGLRYPKSVIQFECEEDENNELISRNFGLQGNGRNLRQENSRRNVNFVYIYDFVSKQTKHLLKYPVGEGQSQKMIFLEKQILIFIVCSPMPIKLKIYSIHSKKFLKEIDLEKMCYNSVGRNFEFIPSGSSKLPLLLNYSKNEVFCRVYDLKTASTKWKFCLSEEEIYSKFTTILNPLNIEYSKLIDDVQWQNECYFVGKNIINFQQDYLVIYIIENGNCRMTNLIKYPKELKFPRRKNAHWMNRVPCDIGAGIVAFKPKNGNSWGTLIINCEKGQSLFMDRIDKPLYICSDKNHLNLVVIDSQWVMRIQKLSKFKRNLLWGDNN